MKIIVYGFVCVTLLLLTNMAQARRPWCYEEFCPKDQEHIGCLHTKGYSKNCGETHELYEINGELRSAMLLELNTFRNYVASGLANISAAAHMTVLKWDPVLTVLAKLLNKQCDIRKTYCSNTSKFRYVTTSEISGYFDKEEIDIDMIVGDMMSKWIIDLNGCSMDEAHHILATEPGKCVGHYIPLIQDHSDAVGCSLLESRGNTTSIHVTLICNFARGNVDDVRPYAVADKPGAGCKTGMSRRFEFLCNEQELVDANALHENLI